MVPLTVISRVTSITSSSGALMSLPSTSSSSVCSSSSLVSHVGGGSAAGAACVAPPDKHNHRNNTHLGFFLFISFQNKRGVPAKVSPVGCAFSCPLGVAVDSACSSALKLYLRLKTAVCDQCKCKFRVQTLMTQRWVSLLCSLQQTEKTLKSDIKCLHLFFLFL